MVVASNCHPSETGEHRHAKYNPKFADLPKEGKSGIVRAAMFSCDVRVPSLFIVPSLFCSALTVGTSIQTLLMTLGFIDRSYNNHVESGTLSWYRIPIRST